MAPTDPGADLTVFGANLQEWEETGLAAREVVVQRLVVLAQCDESARVELHRAATEKVDFCLRWGWRLFTEGWLDLHGSMAEMIGEMRSEVAANRDRLMTKTPVTAFTVSGWCSPPEDSRSDSRSSISPSR